MLKRLILGLLIGAVVGGLVAAGIVAGLGWTAPPAILGFLLAAATGALVGLVAGKPIWASGGQIEAGLKAFFGALLAAGGLYAIRTWLDVPVDLTMVHGGVGRLGELPAAFLPLLAAVLGGFYELDNTPESKDEKGGGGGGSAKKAGGPRVATGAKVRVLDDADDETEDAAPAAKRRSR
jgi:hypothetical protein